MQDKLHTYGLNVGSMEGPTHMVRSQMYFFATKVTEPNWRRRRKNRLRSLEDIIQRHSTRETLVMSDNACRALLF